MIRISTITIRNFLSIGNCTQAINLGLSPLTLIIGENTDFGSGINRNGAGKTSILQATSYAIFGEPLTKITLDNLCNTYNEKGMLVTIDFERDGTAYRIERGRKPSVLRWFVDGRHKDSAQGENKHTQAEIERVVGMSHTMFRHIVALNTFTTVFLREKASEQREIIEELLGIMQLSQRAEALKKLIDVTREAIRSEDATLKASGESNARIQQTIDRANAESETWQTMHDRSLADLLRRAESLSEIDIDAEIAVFDRIDRWLQKKREADEQERQRATITQEISRLKADVSRYDAEASSNDSQEVKRLARQAETYRVEAAQDIRRELVDSLVAEAARHRKSADDKCSDAERLLAATTDLEYQIAHPDQHSCPTCGQGLAGTDHARAVIVELEAQLVRQKHRFDALLVEAQQCNKDADAIDDELANRHLAHAQSRQDRLDSAEALQQEIDAIKLDRDKKREEAANKAHDLRVLIEQLAHKRDECGSMDIGPAPVSSYPNRDAVWQLRRDRDLLANQIETEMEKPNPHSPKIDALMSALVVMNYEPLNELTLKFKHETFLHKLLTAKDSFIRKKIIDQNLSYLNKRLDGYLSRLGLPHEVRFLPDLSVEISLLGKDFDFEQLSRGEMNRLTLATSWAFRDIWENLNTTFNLLFCDEMLDSGLDDAGVEAAWGALQAMGRDSRKNIFVVSHKENLMGRADRVLMVKKEAQFTSFTEAA